MKFFIVILLAVLFAFSSAVFSDTIKVEKSEVIGAEAELSDAVSELVKSSASELGHTLSDGQHDYVLKPNLVRIGQSYVVTLNKMKNDKVVYSSNLKAETAEDLDVVTKRITRSVISEKAARNDSVIGEITEQETTSHSKRKEVVRRWSIGFGPATSLKETKQSPVNLIMAYNWDIEAQSAVRIFYEGLSGFSHMGLGARYYFSPRDLSAYVGGDFGYGAGHARTQNTGSSELDFAEGISGFSLGAVVGVQLFRTSKISLDMGARIATIIATQYIEQPRMLGANVSLHF